MILFWFTFNSISTFQGETAIIVIHFAKEIEWTSCKSLLRSFFLIVLDCGSFLSPSFVFTTIYRSCSTKFTFNFVLSFCRRTLFVKLSWILLSLMLTVQSVSKIFQYFHRIFGLFFGSFWQVGQQSVKQCNFVFLVSVLVRKNGLVVLPS